MKAARWSLLAGGVCGALLALAAAAPAAWLAQVVADGTAQHLQLADARGSVWGGSAVVVLTGGAGSRDASALPGRLHWTLGFEGPALLLQAQQACCINATLRLRQPLLPLLLRRQGRVEVLPAAAASVAAAADPGQGQGQGQQGQVLGQWPAAWLAGLGTPFNTLQPSGNLQLSAHQVVFEQVQGRWRLRGEFVLDLLQIASKLAALDTLGSYRLRVTGSPAAAVDGTDAGAAAEVAPRLELRTLSGALLLDGQGLWSGSDGRLRFQGSAAAAPGAEAALGGLLNIIGRRQGAQAVITIG